MLEFFGVKNFKNKKKATEADSSSGFPQLLRPSVKAKESKGRVESSLRLTEAGANPTVNPNDPNRFRVTLIKEGLGNFGTCYFYTKDSLKLAAQDGIFEGKKANSDHPTESEEIERPERSVKDAFGHYENVRFEEQNGQGMLTADVVVIDSPAFERERAYLRHCIEYSKKYPDQDFMGLSINANGDAVEVSIEQFLQENPLSDAVKSKLAEAMIKGIQIIKPVTRLTSAESVDLVTEAGAGGRIDQMLEQESPMKKFRKFLESKEKEAKKEADNMEGKDCAEAGQGEGEAPAPAEKPKEDAADGDPENDGGNDDGENDADQDKELIRQMLLKFLGDGHDEETYESAKQAVEAYKEMGMDEKEAMEAAGNSLKLAKHMAGKSADPKAAPATQPAPKAAPGQAPAAAPTEAGAAAQDPSKLSPESKKESAKALESKVMRLTAENAQLKEKLKKFELDTFLDSFLRESKLPMHATKKFREALGAPKSEQDIKDKFAIFQEGFGGVGGEADLLQNFIMPEKNNNLRESGGLDFSDCVKKED